MTLAKELFFRIDESNIEPIQGHVDSEIEREHRNNNDSYQVVETTGDIKETEQLRPDSRTSEETKHESTSTDNDGRPISSDDNTKSDTGDFRDITNNPTTVEGFVEKSSQEFDINITDTEQTTIEKTEHNQITTEVYTPNLTQSTIEIDKTVNEYNFTIVDETLINNDNINLPDVAKNNEDVPNHPKETNVEFVINSYDVTNLNDLSNFLFFQIPELFDKVHHMGIISELLITDLLNSTKTKTNNLPITSENIDTMDMQKSKKHLELLKKVLKSLKSIELLLKQNITTTCVEHVHFENKRNKRYIETEDYIENDSEIEDDDDTNTNTNNNKNNTGNNDIFGHKLTALFDESDLDRIAEQFNINKKLKTQLNEQEKLIDGYITTIDHQKIDINRLEQSIRDFKQNIDRISFNKDTIEKQLATCERKNKNFEKLTEDNDYLKKTNENLQIEIKRMNTMLDQRDTEINLLEKDCKLHYNDQPTIIGKVPQIIETNEQDDEDEQEEEFPYHDTMQLVGKSSLDRPVNNSTKPNISINEYKKQCQHLDLSEKITCLISVREGNIPKVHSVKFNNTFNLNGDNSSVNAEVSYNSLKYSHPIKQDSNK